MNEFLTPERREETQAFDGSTQTEYAEPENIRIVVDNDTPPRQTVTGGYTVDLEKHNRTGYPYTGSADLEKLRTAGAEQILDNISRSINQGANNIASEVQRKINDPGPGFGTHYRSKKLAILLCLCTGFLGGHRFYEGKIKTGILYACTGGLLGIGILIDLLILLGKPEYYDPKLNQ